MVGGWLVWYVVPWKEDGGWRTEGGGRRGRGRKEALEVSQVDTFEAQDDTGTSAPEE